MPIYATPPLPPEVESVVEIFGMNQVRVAILLALAEHGGSATTTELVSELKVPQNTISRHLRDLEDAGAITASIPRPERVGGISVSWTLDRSKVRTQLDRLRSRLS